MWVTRDAYLIEGGLELEAVPEQVGTRENVETEAGTWSSDNEPPQVPHVAHGLGPHEGHERDVVLLTLVLVHRSHLRHKRSFNLESPCVLYKGSINTKNNVRMHHRWS